jgi:AcrR family transcriptional regulator
MKRREPGAVRREQLAAAALRRIAEEGLERLTLRAVARAAGIDHATLLYHFPSKEALLQAVAEHVLQRFQSPAGHGEPPHDTPAGFAAIRMELEDVRARLATEPALFAALTELQLRARRDEAIARLLARLDDAWRSHLSDLLRQGMAQGALRSNLDVPTVVDALMIQIKGLGLHALTGASGARLDKAVDAIAAQWERWLAPGS